MASAQQVGTLDWLLDQDVTQRVMARDGVTPAAVRELMQRVGARLNCPASPDHRLSSDAAKQPQAAL
jgi:hypothetical protein